MSSADPYVYPGSSVLRNKFGFTAAERLDYVERALVAQRVTEGTPQGLFDLDHLKAIHRHLFQDVYDWAGETRTVEISKGGQQFQLRRYIETGMADIHRRLKAASFLRGLDTKSFANEAGRIIGDLNYVHPFRDGNGRTQLLYLEQLSEQAGHRLALRALNPQSWIDASRAAHGGDYEPMSAEIERALRQGG